MKKQLAVTAAIAAILVAITFVNIAPSVDLLAEAPTAPTEFAVPYDTLPNGAVIDVDCMCTESCRCMCCYWMGDVRLSCGLEGRCGPDHVNEDCKTRFDGGECGGDDEDCDS